MILDYLAGQPAVRSAHVSDRSWVSGGTWRWRGGCFKRAVQNRITRKGHAQHARDGQSLQLIAPGKETHRVVQHSNYLYKDSTDVKSLLAYTHTAQV